MNTQFTPLRTINGTRYVPLCGPSQRILNTRHEIEIFSSTGNN